MIGFRRVSALLVFTIFVSAFLLSSCSSPASQVTPTGAAAAASPVLPAATGTKAPSATLDSATLTPANAPTSSTTTPTTVTAATATVVATAAAPAKPTQTAAATAQVPETGGQSTAIPSDSASSFPNPAKFAWSPVVSGLNKPLGLAAPVDGTGRMFVLEQPGTIQIIKDGALQPGPFLDITNRVGSRGTEQGLLGIALHPDFASNGFFYLNYTDTNGNTTIARYQVSANDPNRADPNSEKVLLKVDQPYPNHNGGSMNFGPDGYLYMGLGDGGSAGDPKGNGQSTNTLLGKILRIGVDQGNSYTIPADNPFANGGGKPEIWAYGLRNPWRFSFDRLTGDIYIADVGQNQWEEIDYLPAGSAGGANFGWNYREGTHPFRGTPKTGTRLVEPIYEYQHGIGCSVTGGYVYRSQALPEFRGIYLFSDYCSGRVWGLLRGPDGSWQSRELFQTGYNVSSFGQDTQGELYLFDQPSGTLFRLQAK